MYPARAALEYATGIIHGTKVNTTAGIKSAKFSRRTVRHSPYVQGRYRNLLVLDSSVERESSTFPGRHPISRPYAGPSIRRQLAGKAIHRHACSSAGFSAERYAEAYTREVEQAAVKRNRAGVEQVWRAIEGGKFYHRVSAGCPRLRPVMLSIPADSRESPMPKKKARRRKHKSAHQEAVYTCDSCGGEIVVPVDVSAAARWCSVSSVNRRYGPARVERSETRAGPYRPPV